MKKHFLKRKVIAAGLIIVLTSVLHSQTAFDYLRQALGRTVIVSGIQYGYEYNDNLCLAGVLLSSGQSAALTFNFNSGTRYRILGIADEDVQDLDLYLEDSRGDVILRDVQTDSLPILNYNPDFSGKRTVRIKNYRSSQISFCIMVILKQRTYLMANPPSFNLLSQALVNVTRLAENYSFTGTSFPPQTFCLFGGMYGSGQSDGIMNFQIQSGQGGSYAFLGAGSNNCNDVDLQVIQQNREGEIAGTTQCADNEVDKYAIVSCDLWSWNYYYMQYTNYNSLGTSFVFGVVMKEGSQSDGTNFNPGLNGNTEQGSNLGDVIDYISPTFGYSINYLGKPLFQNSKEISYKNLEISTHLYKGIRLYWKLTISRETDNVGYVGILFRNVFGKFAYNINKDILFIPFWVAGFQWNEDTPIWELALGQMNILLEKNESSYIGSTFYEYLSYKPQKTFFVNIKSEISIVDPVWLDLSGNYPFKSGSDYYQIGIGLNLRL